MSTIPFRTGKVVEIVTQQDRFLRAVVETSEGEIDCVGYPTMIGRLRAGDHVVVNVTGISLGLGSGGVGFILWNLDGDGPEKGMPGHIIKLRYTPWQRPVLAAEAPESPHHALVADVTSIAGMPVVACGLHSQMAGVVAGIKAERTDARVGYLMTDGGALPIMYSNLVQDLSRSGLIDVTCTAGHAFGGDLESVNVFSGLVALREAGRVDVVVVAMGPGVVGTGTALGFSAIEQGQVLDAACALGGHGIACIRLSFQDERERHQGVSHHTLTSLRYAARERARVAVPELEPNLRADVEKQLREAGIDSRHEIVTASGEPGIRLLLARGLDPSSMGRPMSQAPELFLAAAAAGAVAGSILAV